MLYIKAIIACSQTIKDEQIKQRQKYLGNWETLKARKVPDKEIACQFASKIDPLVASKIDPSTVKLISPVSWLIFYSFALL